MKIEIDMDESETEVLSVPANFPYEFLAYRIELPFLPPTGFIIHTKDGFEICIVGPPGAWDETQDELWIKGKLTTTDIRTKDARFELIRGNQNGEKGWEFVGS